MTFSFGEFSITIPINSFERFLEPGQQSCDPFIPAGDGRIYFTQGKAFTFIQVHLFKKIGQKASNRGIGSLVFEDVTAGCLESSIGILLRYLTGFDSGAEAGLNGAVLSHAFVLVLGVGFLHRP